MPQLPMQQKGILSKRSAGAARWPAAARNWFSIDLYPAVETAGYYHLSPAGTGSSWLSASSFPDDFSCQTTKRSSPAAAGRMKIARHFSGG